MKRNGYRLFIEMLLLLLCSSMTNATNNKSKEQLVTKHQLMTSRDIIANSFSNITIQNKTGGAITVYGLYINQFADNSPAPHDCTSPTVLYSAAFPSPYAAGAFVSPVVIRNNQKIQIGKNYLYNMLYTAIYFGNQTSPTMPCSLPGCGWYTPDDGNRGDQWCIYVGILAPAPGNPMTANVPPFANLVSNTGYNFDLVTQYGYIGPISCDDKKLTCSVSRAQNVAFPK